MFEFTKLCARYESLTMLERRELLTEKSAQVIKNLRQLDISDIDPIKTLASFIIGSVVSGSDIDEKEYLLIYPSLDDIFNTDNKYANYKNVIEKIKTESCYLDLKVKEIIDLLEKELQ